MYEDRTQNYDPSITMNTTNLTERQQFSAVTVSLIWIYKAFLKNLKT